MAVMIQNLQAQPPKQVSPSAVAQLMYHTKRQQYFLKTAGFAKYVHGFQSQLLTLFSQCDFLVMVPYCPLAPEESC